MRSEDSVLGDGHFAHRGHRRRAAPESRPEELVDDIHIIRLDDVEQCVLRIRAVSTDELEPGDISVEQRVRSPFVARTGLWRVYLRDMEKHEYSRDGTVMERTTVAN